MRLFSDHCSTTSMIYSRTIGELDCMPTKGTLVHMNAKF